jgi:copper chaperone NosL
MKYLGYILFLVPFFISCSVEPIAIDYGHDACEFCKMNIVDNQHAAELVSPKGRAYKFDAIECMMNYLNRKKIASTEMQLLLINDYNQPGQLIDATQASFIISDNIPSPMGAFLSGVDNSQIADELIKNKGGKSFDWESLKERYKVK